MSRKEKIKEILLVDEEKVLEEQLKRIRQFLVLTSEGKPMITVDKSELRQKDLITLYLLGKKLAHDADLTDTDKSELSDLSDYLGLDSRSVAARCSELKREGKISSTSRGEFEIVVANIDRVLSEIENQV